MGSHPQKMEGHVQRMKKQNAYNYLLRRADTLRKLVSDMRHFQASMEQTCIEKSVHWRSMMMTREANYQEIISDTERTVRILNEEYKTVCALLKKVQES